MPSTDTVLQTLFMTEDEMDAKTIVRHVSQLPGVNGCAIMFGDGLPLAGNFPDGNEKAGFSAMAPPFFKRTLNFTDELKLGGLEAFTLYTDHGLLSFFMHGDICLSVRHAGRGFLPGVREKLDIVTRELAGMYSTEKPAARSRSLEPRDFAAPAPYRSLTHASSHVDHQLRQQGDPVQDRLLRPGALRQDDESGLHPLAHQPGQPGRPGLPRHGGGPHVVLRFPAAQRGGHQRIQDQVPALHGARARSSTTPRGSSCLRSVDGIVFVADSQWDKMEENVESFKNLEENLAKQNIAIDEIPYVVQYNKRDLPNTAPVNYLEFLLNNRKKRVQSFEVVSSTGQNVFAALNSVSQLLLHKFNKESEPSNPSSERRRRFRRRNSRAPR